MAYSKARRLADLIRSDGTIDTTKILDATIATADIANDAITANKIVDNIALPGNITTSGTLAPVGVLTANAGLVVDNITIDGTQIDLSSGDLTLDVAGDILLNADGGDIRLQDGSATVAILDMSSNNLTIKNNNNDKDLIFKGYDSDGGGLITALTLDMSDAGTASFNHDVNVAGDLAITGGISGNPTTTTQSASDNTTKIATTAYVTTALANLSDSAPSTLNTLNELAAALGDDANYATTTTAAIAAKLPLAGGSLTGNLLMRNGGNIELGGYNSGNDKGLILSPQDGSGYWHVYNTAGGHLAFGASNTIGSSEKMRIDGSGRVRIGATLGLNHLLNIQTASTSGLAQMEFRNTMAGTQIGMPANTNALSFFVGDNERMRITGPAAAEDRVGIGGDPTSRLHLIGNSDVSDQDVMLKIQDNDTSAGSKIPAIGFYGGTTLQGRIRGSDSGMFFSASANNNDDLTILSSGKVLAGTTSNSYTRGKFTVFGDPGNPATTGTNADKVAIRVATTSGNSQSFDIGMYNSGDYGAWLQASNSGSLNSHSPIVLNPNGGNVGIGVTNPVSKLHVVGGDDADGSIRFQQTVATNNPVLFIEQIGQGGNTNTNQGLLIKVDGQNGGYGNIIRAIGTNSNVNGGVDVEALVVKNDGKVGIGTTAPGHPLSVRAANAKITAESTADSQRVGFQAKYQDHATLYGSFEYTTGDAQLYIDNNFTGNGTNYSDINFRNKDTSGNFQTAIKIKGGNAGNNGYVGIGTTAPQRPLHVNGTEGVLRLTSTASGNNGFEVGVGTASQAFLWNAENSRIEIATNNVERMRIRETGAIEIKGSSTTTSAQAFITNDNSALTIGSSVSGSVVKDIAFNSPSTMMYIDGSAGNVGIGTALPSTKLHLGGTAPGDSIIRQDSTSSGTNWEIGERAAGKWQIFEDDGDSIVATFMSNGNVGIGTPSPTANLQINGSTDVNGATQNMHIRNTTTASFSSTAFVGTGRVLDFSTNSNNNQDFSAIRFSNPGGSRETAIAVVSDQTTTRDGTPQGDVVIQGYDGDGYIETQRFRANGASSSTGQRRTGTYTSFAYINHTYTFDHNGYSGAGTPSNSNPHWLEIPLYSSYSTSAGGGWCEIDLCWHATHAQAGHLHTWKLVWGSDHTRILNIAVVSNSATATAGSYNPYAFTSSSALYRHPTAGDAYMGKLYIRIKGSTNHSGARSCTVRGVGHPSIKNLAPIIDHNGDNTPDGISPTLLHSQTATG